MGKGKIIFLNGVTSSGKTSIVEAIQEQADEFYYVVANDLFQEMIGEKYLRADYWKHLSNAILLMYHTAKLFSDRGHNVIIDGALFERPAIAPHYEQVKTILAHSPLYVIDVYCPLEICRLRNLQRGDRGEFQSAEQSEHMAKDVDHFCRVDTSVLSAKECAAFILEQIKTSQAS